MATGGEATKAMLGETVVALGTGLTDAGYDATTSEIHRPGARLLDWPRSGRFLTAVDPGSV